MMDYERFYSRIGRQVQESAIRRMGAADGDRRDMVSFAIDEWSTRHRLRERAR